MRYNPDIHHRRSVRLKGYDYSQNGFYFITVCTQGRRCLFGEIEKDRMILNDAGKMIVNEWNNLANRFKHIELDEHVVMPNHFHGIIYAGAGVVPALNGATTRVAPTMNATTIGNMIGAFKSITSFEYIKGIKTNQWKPFDGKLWQRNYYEHIIRNETSLQNIRQYIVNNPVEWKKDELFV